MTRSAIAYFITWNLYLPQLFVRLALNTVMQNNRDLQK